MIRKPGGCRAARHSSAALGRLREEHPPALTDELLSEPSLRLDHGTDSLLNCPRHLSLWTTAFRRCQIQEAQSVACFSTAGYHQRKPAWNIDQVLRVIGVEN